MVVLGPWVSNVVIHLVYAIKVFYEDDRIVFVSFGGYSHY